MDRLPRSAREGAATGREPAGGPDEPDEYRVKLYKVACRVARDERERQLLDYEARLRERV
jgi:hypothetical protein